MIRYDPRGWLGFGWDLVWALGVCYLAMGLVTLLVIDEGAPDLECVLVILLWPLRVLLLAWPIVRSWWRG